jgi:acetylornithine deacetylase/succinyl-diaminopimelate desuccinylase-like protein
VQGGYGGKGEKGVIPSHALAKLSIRLVPGQDPHEIEDLFRGHVARVAPPDHAYPVYIDLSHPAIRWASAACREVFGTSPVYLRSGGTIPVVDSFQRWLGIPTVLIGFALPNDRMHAPNEKFHLPNFYNGIATSIRFLANAGAMPGDRGGYGESRSSSTHQIARERIR